MICTRAKDLVGSNRCLVRLLLDHSLLLRLGWRFEIVMSVEVVLLEFDGFDLHNLDLLEVLFVV